MQAQSSMPHQIIDYEDTLRVQMQFKSHIVNVMEKALQNEEFIVYIQPKVELKSNAINSCEALVRWLSDGELLSPVVFIDELERNGKIVDLDFYVVRKICKMLAELKQENKQVVPVSVNCSRHHLSNQRFVDDLIDILKEYHVATRDIIIEFTETTTIEHLESMKDTIEALHLYGFKV